MSKLLNDSIVSKSVTRKRIYWAVNKNQQEYKI